MKYKRKELLINPSFQIKFIILLLVQPIILTSFFYALFIYFIGTLKEYAISIGYIEGEMLSRFIDMHLEKSNIIFYVAMSGSIIFSVVSGLIFGHRIAGPIYRLKQIFRGLSKGHEVRFRKNDFFQDIPEELKKFLSDK